MPGGEPVILLCPMTERRPLSELLPADNPRADEFLRARWRPERMTMLLNHLDYMKDIKEVCSAKVRIFGTGDIDWDGEEETRLQMLWEVVQDVVIKNDIKVPRKKPIMFLRAEAEAAAAAAAGIPPPVPIQARAKPPPPPLPVINVPPAAPVDVSDDFDFDAPENMINLDAHDEFVYAQWDPARMPVLIKRMARLRKNKDMQDAQETICGEGDIDYEDDTPALFQMLWEATEKVIANMPRIIYEPNPTAPLAPHVPQVPAPAESQVTVSPPAHTDMTKPFECPVCGQTFAQKHGLSRHTNTHKERRFDCPVQDCEYATTEKRYIQCHLKAFHKINV